MQWYERPGGYAEDVGVRVDHEDVAVSKTCTAPASSSASSAGPPRCTPVSIAQSEQGNTITYAAEEIDARAEHSSGVTHTRGRGARCFDRAVCAGLEVDDVHVVVHRLAGLNLATNACQRTFRCHPFW